MANFNLTYTLPYARLKKLSRSAARKGFQQTWWWTWGVIGVFAVLYFAILIFYKPIRNVFLDRGITYGPDMLLIALVIAFLVSLYAIRRMNAKQVQARVDFDQDITLTTDDTGVHIDTPQIGYHLKWRGLSQVLIEPDGAVLSHGALFFLVPSAAFASKDDEQAFLKRVCENLTPEARARSKDALAKAGLA